MTYLAPSRARRRYPQDGPRSGSSQRAGLDLADPRELLRDVGLLGLDLARLVEMLQGAAAADPEMRAARLHPVRRGLQHFQQRRLVIAAVLAAPRRHHDLARQRAVHEHRLAVDAGDAAAVVRKRHDLHPDGLAGRPQVTSQAAENCCQCVSLRSSSHSQTRAISCS